MPPITTPKGADSSASSSSSSGSKPPGQPDEDAAVKARIAARITGFGSTPDAEASASPTTEDTKDLNERINEHAAAIHHHTRASLTRASVAIGDFWTQISTTFVRDEVDPNSPEAVKTGQNQAEPPQRRPNVTPSSSSSSLHGTSGGSVPVVAGGSTTKTGADHNPQAEQALSWTKQDAIVGKAPAAPVGKDKNPKQQESSSSVGGEDTNLPATSVLEFTEGGSSSGGTDVVISAQGDPIDRYGSVQGTKSLMSTNKPEASTRIDKPGSKISAKTENAQSVDLLGTNDFDSTTSPTKGPKASQAGNTPSTKIAPKTTPDEPDSLADAPSPISSRRTGGSAPEKSAAVSKASMNKNPAASSVQTAAEYSRDPRSPAHMTAEFVVSDLCEIRGTRIKPSSKDLRKFCDRCDTLANSDALVEHLCEKLSFRSGEGDWRDRFRILHGLAALHAEGQGKLFIAVFRDAAGLVEALANMPETREPAQVVGGRADCGESGLVEKCYS